MRALLSRQAGGPESLTLEELPEPTCAPGHILVQVATVGVNYPDFLMIQDMYQVRPPRPFAPGGEAAGIVTSVGEGVTRFRPGDRVLCRTGWGGMVECLHVSEDRCYALPDDIPFTDAVTLLFTYATVLFALKTRCALAKGERLLVLGASGGVGIAALQLGKALGAQVCAASSSAEKLELAMTNGADSGVVYARDMTTDASKSFTRDLKAALPDGQSDVVLDPVGGSYAEPALRTLAPGGRFGVVGFTAGIPSIPLNLVLLKSCQIVGVNWRDFAMGEPAAFLASLDMLYDFYRSGAIRPAVTDVVPLEGAAAAIARLGDRTATGKFVVAVQDLGL